MVAPPWNSCAADHRKWCNHIGGFLKADTAGLFQVDVVVLYEQARAEALRTGWTLKGTAVAR